MYRVSSLLSFSYVYIFCNWIVCILTPVNTRFRPEGDWTEIFSMNDLSGSRFTLLQLIVFVLKSRVCRYCSDLVFFTKFSYLPLLPRICDRSHSKWSLRTVVASSDLRWTVQTPDLYTGSRSWSSLRERLPDGDSLRVDQILGVRYDYEVQVCVRM